MHITSLEVHSLKKTTVAWGFIYFSILMLGQISNLKTLFDNLKILTLIFDPKFSQHFVRISEILMKIAKHKKSTRSVKRTNNDTFLGYTTCLIANGL